MTRRLAVRFAVLGLIMGVVGGLGPSAAAQEPPPPPLEVEIEVDSVGIIHPVSLTRNEVALTGTAVCSSLASLDVFAEVRQLADGRFLIHGHGGEFFHECDGEISWTFHVQSENGLFAGGLADVEIGAFAFDGESGDSVFVEVLQEIRLLGPEGTFTDDDGNIHEGAIEAIAAEGITKGCNPPVNDRYCPSGTVTRGQIATFFHRYKGSPDVVIDASSHRTVYMVAVGLLANRMRQDPRPGRRTPLIRADLAQVLGRRSCVILGG